MSADHGPYTQSEIDRIRGHLPENRQRALNGVIAAARDFVVSADLQPKKKSNAPREIEALRNAVNELMRALGDLSTSTAAYLKSRCEQSKAYDDVLDPDALMRTLHRFKFENRRGLQEKPAQPKAGPIAKVRVHALLTRLKASFKMGHGGTLPTRGWPEFRKACTDPLEQRHKLEHRSPKGWQEALKKRRNNPPRAKAK
jgi:hypothetical protein